MRSAPSRRSAPTTRGCRREPSPSSTRSGSTRLGASSSRRPASTPLTDSSPALQEAVIASEDRRFYRHGGVDGAALVAATVRRLMGGSLRGASTISMQLAALFDPALHRQGGPRTLTQKLRQMRL